MFASRLFPSRISLFCTLTLLATELATQVIGKEHEVRCLDGGIGDTTLFTTTIKALLPGDVLLLGPCNYKFENKNYKIGYDFRESIYNSPDPDTFGNTEGVLIKGTGKGPAQTVLHAVIHSFPVNVMFENLTINGKQSTENVYYTDNDLSVVFRKCVLISGDLTTAFITAAVWAISGRLTFIDSEIINGSTFATEADRYMGVWVTSGDDLNKMNLMRSSIEKFPIALYGGRWGTDTQKSIQVHKTNLWMNTVECCVDYVELSGAEICENKVCPLAGQILNTPVGNSKIAMNESVDLLGEYGFPIRQTYVPLRISFPEVKTGGYTFTYKLPSAHPALPTHAGKQYHPGNAAAPQYFQFDSSAAFSNKKEKRIRIGFDKSVIDSKFDNPNNIKAFHSVGGKVWKKRPLKLKVRAAEGVAIYLVILPKRKRLKSLIAFGEI